MFVYQLQEDQSLSSTTDDFI